VRTMHVSIFHNIVWSKYKGGVFSAINDLVAGSGNKVTFTQIAETEGERMVLGGVDRSYHRYPFDLLFEGAYGAIPTWQRVKALAKKAQEDKADLVILPGYERIEYWVMLAILTMRGVPRAVFCDSTANDRPRATIKSVAKRIFFSFCQGFFCYGTRSREYLMMYGVPANRIFFRCQAAALAHDYSEAWALSERIARAPKSGSAPVFLYVGRLSAEKGLDTLLQAMAAVVSVIPGAQLELVGAGALEEKLRLMVAELELQSNVSFLGSMGVKQLAERYASATAFVLPSTSEPWGLVVNEALSHGCPAVVSQVCGCVPELVVPGVTGYSFQAGSVSELHTQMLAAATQFSNIERTAQDCLQLMQQFTPENAARQIMLGAKVILDESRKSSHR